MRGGDAGGLTELTGLGIECENCGRQRRLTRHQVQKMLGTGIHTVEQLGRKLRCRVCAEQGKMSKNVSVVPYYRCESVAEITPL